MELVQDELRERHALPRPVGPREGTRVYDARRPADSPRLEPGAGIGQRGRAVEHEFVVVARLGGRVALEHSVAGARERVVDPAHAHGDCGRSRRPDAELHQALFARHGPKGPCPGFRQLLQAEGAYPRQGLISLYVRSRASRTRLRPSAFAV